MAAQSAMGNPELSLEGIDQACAHIINLSGVRATLGTLWTVTQKSVRHQLEGVISKSIVHPDYYRQLDDERYLVVTPTAPDDKGVVAIVEIVSKFLKSLNGSCELRSIQIEKVESAGPGGVRGRALDVSKIANLAQSANIRDIAMPSKVRQAATRQEEAPRPDQHVASRSGVNVVHRFEPIWDIRNQAITTYLCGPKSITSADEPHEPLTLQDLTLPERCNVEIGGLLKGIGELSESLDSGERFLLCIPISFELLSSPFGREEFLKTCRGLPVPLRKYLVFLLSDVPLGVTHSRLSDLAVVIKPYGRIIVSVASGCRNLTSYVGHGFNGLALDLAKCTKDIHRTHADILHICAAGRETGWGSAILNLDDRALLKSVLATDCRFIQGKTVGECADKPKPMSRLLTGDVVPATDDPGSEEWF